MCLYNVFQLVFYVYDCIGRLIVRGWFLKWNCFFIVWVRREANFRIRWSVEAVGVRTKLRPKASTSLSFGDSW